MFDDARVVARREAGGAGAAREREQLGEAEAAVAADARVRRLALGVAGDEGVDDCARGTRSRRSSVTCGRPSRWQVSRAAMTASGEQQARSASGPAGSSQRRSVTPTASFARARRSATALSTPPLIATATRSAERGARKTGPIAFASASTGSVSPPTAAASSRVSPSSGASTRPRPPRRSGRHPAAGGRRPSRRSATNLRRPRPCSENTQRGSERMGLDPDRRRPPGRPRLRLLRERPVLRDGPRAARDPDESPRPTSRTCFTNVNVVAPQSRRRRACTSVSGLARARRSTRFTAAGIAAGFRSNGVPGYRDYGPGYYAAYLLDPDGNNIEALYRDEGNPGHEVAT